MPKFKRILKKKGFTIVELVIVIAVISILAAVTIPAFSSIVRKAQISAASQLSANFNKAVVGYEAVNEPITLMHDAVTAVEDYGFEQSDLVDDDGRYYVVWDSENNRFVVLDGKEGSVCSEEGNTTPLTKLWKAVSEIPSEQLTSLYLTDEFDEKTVSVTVGVDVGNNESVEEIIYTDTDEQVKDIIIRVNDPQTIVNLDNKGNDNVTVIGLNEDTGTDVTPPTEPEEPNVPETPKDTDAPKPPDEPVEDENSYLIPESEDKVVYSFATNKQYDSLIDAAEIGGELILINDVNESTIKITKDTVLDLNGFSIGYLIEESDSTVLIESGRLTVIDSSENKTGTIINNSNVEFEDVLPFSAIRVSGGALVLESGKIIGTRSAIYCDPNVSVTINGGEIRGIGDEGMGIYVSDNVNLTINGGYISTETTNRYAISAKDSTSGYTITVNDVLIEGAIGNYGSGSLIINNGTIRGVNAAIVIKKGPLEINGGEFSTDSTIVRNRGDIPEFLQDSVEQVGAVIHVDATLRGSKQTKINITINGGTFVSKNFHVMCFTGQDNESTNNKPSVIIKGGTFVSPDGYETIAYKSSITSGFLIEVETVSRCRV